MKKDQNGFGASAVIAIVAIVIVIGAVGFVGYKTLSKNKQSTASTSSQSTTPAASSTAKNDQSSASSDTTVTTNTSTTPGFVTIKEWGIAFRIGSADQTAKLGYEIRQDANGMQGAFAVIAQPNDPACHNLAFEVERSDTQLNSKYLKLGNASGYYTVVAAPSDSCDKGATDAAVAVMNGVNDSLDKLDWAIQAAN